MLPSVRPLTVRSQNRLQFMAARLPSHRRHAAHHEDGPHGQTTASELPDRQEGATGGRLPDAELTTLDVALTVEAHVQAEHRLLQVGLADLGTNLRAGGLAVLARTIDRAADDLSRNAA